MAYENQPNNEYETINDDTLHGLKEQPPHAPDYLELLPDNEYDTNGKTGNVSNQIKQGMTGGCIKEPMDDDEYEQITTEHDYQHLQREVNNYAVLKPRNETGTKGYQQQDHVSQSTHAPTGHEADSSIVRQQMAVSEEGKQGSKICPPPTWLRWLLTILGLSLLIVIVTLLVFFLSGKYSHLFNKEKLTDHIYLLKTQDAHSNEFKNIPNRITSVIYMF